MGQTVIIRKIAAAENPVCSTPDKDAYIPGYDNGAISFPIEYEVEGYLQNPIEVGKPVVMARERRNDIRSEDVFQTTAVVEADADGFKTKNSVYTVSYL